MKKLKFSFDYHKLPREWEGTNARLLYITAIKLEEQTSHYLEFDTKIRLNILSSSPKHYLLPKKGVYLLLLFKHESGAIFTTLRRFIGTKLDYYDNSIGEWFELVKVNE